jgi:hypothetical protein
VEAAVRAVRISLHIFRLECENARETTADPSGELNAKSEERNNGVAVFMRTRRKVVGGEARLSCGANLVGCRFESLAKGMLCSIPSSHSVHQYRVGAYVGASLPGTCSYKTCSRRMQYVCGVANPHLSNHPASIARFHRDRQDHRDCRDRRKRGYRSHVPLSAGPRSTALGLRVHLRSVPAQLAAGPS